MKKKISLITALVLICACMGCTDINKNNEQSNIQSNIEIIEENSADKSNKKEMAEQLFTSEYHYESDSIQINLDEIRPDKVVWYKATCNAYPINYEDLGRFFMPDDGSNEKVKEQHVILSNETEDGMHKEIYGWSDEAAGYSSIDSSFISACLWTDNRDPNYNLYEYKEKKDFSFGTDEEVKDRLYEEFNKIGIDLANDFMCETYYLDHETMKEQEMHMDMDGNIQEELYKNDWSENDDTYLMYFHHLCNGLRDFQYNPFWGEIAQNENAQIVIMYNRNGISRFDIQNMFQYTLTDEQITLMDFEDIMKSVISYYDDIVDGTKRKILSAELIVDCTNADSSERKLIPVWAFWVEETNSDGNVSKYELRVNAITGNIIAN